MRDASRRMNIATKLERGRRSSQAKAAKDGATREVLKVMTWIQQLHQVQTLLVGQSIPDLVDLSEHLQCISRGIAGAIASERVTMTVDMEVLDVAFKRDVAVPLGLILIEALTNSLKHAFPGTKRGHILVKLRNEGTGLIRLEIEHDGCGMQVGSRSNALGPRLIKKLAQRVGGEASVASGPDGAVVRVIFPKPAFDDDL